MEHIIPLVTTPLALAALCLLLGSGLLKILLKQRSSAIGKLIVRYGFLLAISLIILSDVAFIISSRFSSEVIITGSVRNEDGKYLARVILDIPGKSRSITDDNGAFAMVVPYSRADSTYRIDASLNGYLPTSIFCNSSTRNSISITMKSQLLKSDILLSLSGDILVSHFLGSPQIDIPIKFYNPTSETIQISSINVNVKENNGVNNNLMMVNSYALPGTPLMPPLTLITLKAGESFSTISIFADFNQEIIQRSAKLRQQLTSNPIFFQNGPRLGINVIDNELVNQIKSFAYKNWFWKSSSYSVIISCIVKGFKYELTKNITLTTEQVNKMKAVISYYKEGFGLIYGSHLAQISNAQSYYYLPAK